jgi:hypothetical protein
MNTTQQEVDAVLAHMNDALPPNKRIDPRLDRRAKRTYAEIVEENKANLRRNVLAFERKAVPDEVRASARMWGMVFLLTIIAAVMFVTWLSIKIGGCL